MVRRRYGRWLGMCAVLGACGGGGTQTPDDGTTSTTTSATSRTVTSGVDDSSTGEGQLSFTLSDGAEVVVRA